MAEQGVRLVDTTALGLTQLYLSQRKRAAVMRWFLPSLEGFEPVTVHRFGGDRLHLTDGHTRTFVAWEHGIARIPVLYDNSEIVTCPMGQIQYRRDIEWCDRFGLRTIADLRDRVVPQPAYEALWWDRCERMHTLELALYEGRLDADAVARARDLLVARGLYVYGCSEDFATLFCDDAQGRTVEMPREGLK